MPIDLGGWTEQPRKTRDRENGVSNPSSSEQLVSSHVGNMWCGGVEIGLKSGSEGFWTADPAGIQPTNTSYTT